MTLSEFKAWFSGYTEDMDGPPSRKQWKRIKEMVKDIDGQAITERIWIDRYRPYYYEWLGHNKTTVVPNTWCSSTAMYAAGKSEQATLTLDASKV